MNSILKNQLIEELNNRILPSDISHEVNHTLRVLENALKINEKEKGDLDIIIPASIFHDLITYPKNDPRNKFSVDESAKEARKILENLKNYPKEKIEKVEKAILCTSLHRGIKADFLEAYIVQDADMLELTGAISIMRVSASSEKMKRPFYDPIDPFAENRELDDLAYEVDFFYTIALKVEERIHTETGKIVASNRTKFINKFLEELKQELAGK